ncbi:MAG: hypothetical protein WCE81_00250 [Halobacteriota archaeon]
MIAELVRYVSPIPVFKAVIVIPSLLELILFVVPPIDNLPNHVDQMTMLRGIGMHSMPHYPTVILRGAIHTSL